MADTDQLLKDRDWERISAQLTTFAWKNTGRRSWELAKELSQQAIEEHLADPDAWDPSRKTLLRHLGHEVLRIARNDIRRHRNKFEIAMDYVDLVENEVETSEATAEELLHDRRIAKTFHDRLLQRLHDDGVALVVVALMMEEIETPTAQEKASGLPLPSLKDARRRVFYQAQQLAKELSEELGAEAGVFVRAVAAKVKDREVES